MFSRYYFRPATQSFNMGDEFWLYKMSPQHFLFINVEVYRRSVFCIIIQNTSRLLRIGVLDTCARIVTFISKSSPLCLCVACVPSEVF